ncbi:unnamed protein product [Mucor hiemalis]
MKTSLLPLLLAISSIHATEIQDIPHILGDAASSATSSIAKAATTNEEQQQQLLQLFSSLSRAIQLALTFFKSMFSFFMTCISTASFPFLWIASSLWSQFVVKPFDLFMHVVQFLYPVILFCFAAVCCGLFIGGCAGFAAEACSSLLISATWGPQPQAEEVHEESVVEESLLDNKDDDDFSTTHDENEGDAFRGRHSSMSSGSHRELPSMLTSTASSIWESSSSFFGMHPPTSPPASANSKKMSKRALEKEPLIQPPKVEAWRDSISPPVLIRRKKLSPTKDNWEWDEDEDDIYQQHQQQQQHQQTSSSSPSVYNKNR